MRTVAVVTFLAHLVAGGAAATPSPDELFRDGNAAFRDGRFAEAAQRYEEIRAGGWTSGPLSYNLGNAYYRLGQIGRAMASYQRALRALPRDEDVRANIAFVRARTVDETLAASRFPLLEIPGLLAGRLTWREWLVAGESTYALLLFAGALFLFRPALRPRLRTPLQVIASIFAVLVFLLIAAVQDQVLDRKGCVIGGEVPVRSGPGPRYTEEFVVHQGTVGRLRRSAEGWTLFEISPDLKGWVPSDTIEEI